MKQMILTTGIAGLMALSFTACQKDPLNDLTADESRIYVTNHDSTVNFTSFKTFSIADSVGVIENGKGRDKELTAFDAAVIGALKTNMQQRGYQLVDKTATATRCEESSVRRRSSNFRSQVNETVC